MKENQSHRSFPIIPVLGGGVLLVLCLCVLAAGLLLGGRPLLSKLFQDGSRKPVMPAAKVLETKTQAIGAEGGAIVLDSGARLVFPAGAVAQRINVQVNRLDPSLYLGEGSEGVVLDLSAPVDKFQKKVEFHIPLPDWYTPDDADMIIAGALDETTGAVVYQPPAVQIADGRPELVLQTDHFSSWVIDWVKDKLGILPPQAGPLEIPYYSQGSTTYCWAATLQMVAEAAKHSEVGGEVFDVIGTVGIDEEGLQAKVANTYPRIDTLIHLRTGVYTKRVYWPSLIISAGQPPDLGLYIRRQILLKHPVVLVSAAKQHAFVVVGYDGNDFYVHDPAGVPGSIYKKMSEADLSLVTLAYDNATVVVPLSLAADRPLVTVNIMDYSLEFVKPKTSTEADNFQFRWDYTNQQGYSFKSKRDGKAVASIDGEATELRLVPSGGGIEIANANRSGGSEDVSVWIDITGHGPARTSYSEKISTKVAPGTTGKVNFKPIGVDAFRDPAPTPSEYTFKVTILVGGKVVDDAAFNFVLEPSKTPTPTITPTTTAKVTPTAAAATGQWVLKLITPDVGKVETLFSFPGLACNGGTKAASTETSATTTAAGTCQVKGALVANETAQHSWSRPPDRLTPDQVDRRHDR